MPYIKKQQRKKKKNTDNRSNRALRSRVYHSKEWRELREFYISRHPLCEKCTEEGRTTPAECVHHVDSFTKYFRNNQITEKALEVAYDPNNLMSLCVDCHLEIHGQKKKKGDDEDDFMD